MQAHIIRSTNINVPVVNQDTSDCGCNNPVRKLWALTDKLLNGKDKEVYRFPGVEVEIRKV